MLLIPYRTHAYREGEPVGTLGLIAFNVLVFIACWVGATSAEDWAMVHGRFQPVQWVSSAFVHADLMHLIFNMVFLWAFGQIVEGVTRTPLFLVLYFAIVILSGAIETFLFWDGGSMTLGASGAIYGLIGAAALCAPKAEIDTFSWVFFRVYFATLSVFAVGVIYTLIELLYAALGGFSLSSSLLHLLGLVAGLGLAALGLLTGKIDGGGWDWFSLRRADTRRGL